MGIPHPEGCSGYGRSRADDTSASPPPGAFPPPPRLIWRRSRRVSSSRWRCPCAFLVLHEERHASCQTDRSQQRACVPDGDQCLLHRRANQGRTVPAQTFRGAPDQHLLSQEIPLSCLVQDPGGMPPAVSRLLTEIVHHRRLCCLPCLQN